MCAFLRALVQIEPKSKSPGAAGGEERDESMETNRVSPLGSNVRDVRKKKKDKKEKQREKKKMKQ